MARRPKPRIFLDTNVIFSALYSPTGPPADILRLHIDGKIRIVVSPQVLEELARAITAKLPAAASAVQALLLNAPPEVVPDPSPGDVKRWTRLVNPVDAPIIAAAVQTGADYLITGDAGFLAKASEIEKRGITVLSPRQFIDGLH